MTCEKEAHHPDPGGASVPRRGLLRFIVVNTGLLYAHAHPKAYANRNT